MARHFANPGTALLNDSAQRTARPRKLSWTTSFVIWNLLGGIGWAVLIGLAYLFLHVIGVAT